jgi:hypothetical protein
MGNNALGRMLSALLALVLLVVVMATILRELELPGEMVARATAVDQYRMEERHFFESTFDFIANLQDSQLGSCGSEPSYRPVKRSDYDLPHEWNPQWDTMEDSCSLCFPAAWKSAGIPVGRVDHPLTWIIGKRVGEQGNFTYSTVSRVNKTPGVQECGGSTAHCEFMCPLALPTISQVEACLQPKRSFGESMFKRGCLVNSPNCPNCDRLNGTISIASIKAGAKANVLWRSRFEQAGFVYDLDKADLYLDYKRKSDATEPSRDDFNFDWIGSAFFSATVLSTVGYGNFAPSTTGAKWVIVLAR